MTRPRTRAPGVIDRAKASPDEVGAAIQRAVRTGRTLTISEDGRPRIQIVTPKARPTCTRCGGTTDRRTSSGWDEERRLIASYFVRDPKDATMVNALANHLAWYHAEGFDKGAAVAFGIMGMAEAIRKGEADRMRGAAFELFEAASAALGVKRIPSPNWIDDPDTDPEPFV